MYFMEIFLQEELKRIKISAEDNNSLIMELETKLNRSQMETEIMWNNLETRCSQLNECKEFSLKLEAQLEEARAREAELLSQSENANAQKLTADEKLGQVCTRYKKLAANYKLKLQVIQELEAKIEKLKHATDSAVGEPQLLQVGPVETKSELDELKLLLSRTESDLSASQTQLQCAQKESSQMAEEGRKMMEQLQQKSERVCQLEQLQIEAEFKAREAESYSRRLMDKHSFFVEQFCATREQHRTVLECKETERNRAAEELRLKENEVGELRQLAGL